MTVTTDTYGTFEQAFDYFNKELFRSKLPPCLITLQRKKNSYGYYAPHRFKGRVNKGARTDEIALNPANFVGRSDEEILSTLVHEMVHHYQRLYGKPGRGRYHNPQWADLMMEIGLMPSSTGMPGGKVTGDHMSHYIKPGGIFEKACRQLLESGFRLHWEESDEEYVSTRVKAGKPIDTPNPVDTSTSGRVKFTCPTCGLNAWAKPSALLLCGLCLLQREIIRVMHQADWDEEFEEWTVEELSELDLVPFASPGIRGLAKSSSAPISQRGQETDDLSGRQ